MKDQKANPATNPDALFAQALSLHQAGKLDEAETIAKTLLQSFSKNAYVLNFLGIITAQKDKTQEALELFEQAIASNPDYSEAHSNRAIIFFNRKNYPEAMAGYKKAIALNPNNAEAHNNIALIQKDLKQYGEALANCDKAIALQPQYAEAYNTKGLALQGLGKYEEAIASYDKAIALNPASAMAYNNRAAILFFLLRFDEAIVSSEKAIALSPAFAMAYNTRSSILFALKKFDEARASLDKAIALNPGYADAYCNKSAVLLSLGEFEEGWRLYEWRWKINETDEKETSRFSKPLWLGKESLAGKTILLHIEQGFGDALQFCRYVPLVEKLGAKVILEVQPALLSLMAPSFAPTQVIGRGQPLPNFDYYCPLMSLPLALGTTLTTVPANVPYLQATEEKRKLWQERLGQKKKRRVGLVWSGLMHPALRYLRSVPLELLASVLDQDCEFHSLQKEVRPEDKAFLANSKIITHADNLADFSDTAALISEMDLVISVDTGVAHLAGALGKPLWLMLHYVADYRWMLERSDSPWYPTAKLFRQQTPGDWTSMMESVKDELTGFT